MGQRESHLGRREPGSVPGYKERLLRECSQKGNISGKWMRGGHKSGLGTPASPFPTKEASAKGVGVVGLRRRAGKGQWEGGMNEAHKGL